MLKISEHFYSVQGEGISAGMPAYFIRLAGCNLMCGGSNGSLLKEGKSTWWCDSEKLWRNGTNVPNEDLINTWKEQGIYERILSGKIHLVWTGGEPTLPLHVNSIQQFIDYITEIHPQHTIFNEIETNGTIVVPKNFYFDTLEPDGRGFKLKDVAIINQINCSPKLVNSGISIENRYNISAIMQIIKHENSWFKFVITKEEDIEEIEKDWIAPLNLPSERIILMPGVDNRDDLAEMTRFTMEMTKKYGYRCMPRLHILAWNRTCGV